MRNNKSIDYLSSLAQAADIAIDKKDIGSINKLISKIENLIDKTQQKNFLYYLKYILANLYSTKSNIENIQHSLSSKYMIKSLNLLRQIHGKNLPFKNQINTNLANIFNYFNRSLEGLKFRSINFNLEKYDSSFVSSYWNYYELLGISSLMEDKTITIYFQLKAFYIISNLINNIESCPHIPLRDLFLKIKSAINAPADVKEKIRSLVSVRDFDIVSHVEWCKENNLDDALSFYDNNNCPSLPKEELKYKEWCLNNYLVLDYRNLITKNWVAHKDSLQFPSHITEVHNGPIFNVAFSTLKREFCFARHLFYEGYIRRHPVYEDNFKDMLLFHAFDGITYNGYIEKIKESFRICFSILDKIAFLINEYYRLGSDEHKVYFTSEWLKNIKKIDNPYLLALYWLSCDLSPQGNESPEPDSRKIKEVRNFLEHKFVRIRTSFPSCIWDNSQDFFYTISENELKKLTFKIFHLVRFALFYFCLSVRYNELEKNINPDLVFQLEPPIYKKFEI